MVRASPPSASVLDWDLLTRRFGDAATAYAAADPFPHAVFHDLFELNWLRGAAAEFPDLDDMSFQVDRDYALKSAEHRWDRFGPSTREIVASLQSGPFVDALEALTGISGLIPDPHLSGGGQHQIRRDGFLKVHADFNALERLSLDRRINVLLYLNDDWDESWGGALELWDRSMTAAVVRVPPTINTLVVFSTSDDSFHGHPDPLSCPPGRSRRSLAFYYYTSPRPHDGTAAHSTLYQTRPDGRDDSAALPYAQRMRLAGRHARRAAGVLIPPSAKAKLRSVLGRADPGSPEPGSSTRELAHDSGNPNFDPGRTVSTRSPQVRRLIRSLGRPLARRALAVEPLRARLLDPHVVRNLALSAIRAYEIGDYGERVALGAVDRPHYAYCVWNAAVLARSLGMPRMSVVEFGVAGGNGLLALEQHASRTSEALDIEIEVYGFDTGQGLPAPGDYRDLPYHWKAGFFSMDVELLRSRLEHAKLVLGEVRETIPRFTEQYDPAPIGAVMQDLDFYSSTVDALALFDVDEKYRLPRVYSYFDDIVGSEVELYNDFTGERLAISEFNENHPMQKISPAYHLLGRPVVEPWFHRIFTVHDFDHSRYCDFVSATGQQRTLVPEPPVH